MLHMQVEMAEVHSAGLDKEAAHRSELEVQSQDILRHERTCGDGNVHPLGQTEGQVKEI